MPREHTNMTDQRNIQSIISDFSSAWPSGRKDFRTEDDQSWKVYAKTLRDLVSSGQIESVEKRLQDGNQQVRALAARALGFMAQERSSPVLVKALQEDGWPTVRLLAADALGMIATDDARSELSAAVGEEKNKDVKLHLEVALLRPSGREESALRNLMALATRELDSARIDDPAPEISLCDGNGDSVELGQYKNKRAVALYFLYGDG